jgi:hypothetical protein
MAMPRPQVAPPRAAPAPPPPSRRGAVVAIVVVGVLVLAGAAAAVAFFALRGEAPQELTQAEAQSRVQASLQAANDGLMGEASDGDLRKVTAQAEPAESTPSGPTDLFAGFGRMSMTVEYGRDDVVRFDLHMASGAVTVAFTMYCTPERQYMVAGGEAFASRPRVDPDDAACTDFQDGFAVGADGAPEDGVLPVGDLEASQADITRNKDGSVHAEFEEEGAHVVLDLDAKGRLRTMTVTDPQEGTWTMAYEYGDRSTIRPPEDFTLLPASVALEEGSEGGLHTWTVLESPEEPPLADFEVRVQDYASSFGFGDDGDDVLEQSILATFALTGSPQSDGNLTFRFTDADADGKLTAGDSFTIRDLAAGEDEETFGFSYFPYQAVLYDRVAEGEVNSGFNEMPSPAWLALGALALASLAFRRR